MDLRSGYWQVAMAPEDKCKTAFVTDKCQYCFKVLPFGVTNGPPAFSRLMAEVLRGLDEFTLVYLDDILIFSKCFEDHMKHLEIVFERLRAAKLKICPEKCYFCMTELLYLGHVVSRQGIAVDPKKIESVQKFAAPRNVTEIRSFLGMAGFYRRLIRDYAHTARPLTDLLAKGRPFHWGPDQQEAFENLRDKLISAPVVSRPDFSKPFVLCTDWQPHVIGAVLEQLADDGKTRLVIAYASRVLRGAELNYSPAEGECLAALWAITYYRHYLHCLPFELVTDQESLRWLMTTRNFTGRLARWSIVIQDQNMTIRHRPGRENVVADALTRMPITEPIDHALMCCHENSPGLILMFQDIGSDESDEAPSETDDNSSEISEILHTTEDTDHITSEDEINEEISAEGDDGAALPFMNPTPPSPDAEHGAAVPADTTDPSAILRRGEANQNIQEIEIVTTEEIEEERDDAEARIEDQNPARHPILDIWLDDSVRDFMTTGDFPPEVDNKEKARIKRRASTFVVQDTCIYKTATRRHNVRVVPPPGERQELIRAAHELGHYGVQKTYSMLKTHFYWHEMHKEIKEYCKTCNQCKMQNQTWPKRNTLYPLPVTGVFHRVGIDLIGPLPETTNGYLYIMTIIDYASKFAAAYPLTDKEAGTTAGALEHYLAIHSCPLELLTDQGNEFLGAFQEVCRRNNIKHSRTSAYSPQTNGLVERFNGTLSRALRKMVQDNLNAWDEYLNPAVLGYNCSKQASTRFSPFRVFYGREPILPMHNAMLHKYIVQLPGPSDATPEDIALEITIRKREDAQLLITSKALANIEEAQVVQAHSYVARRSGKRSIDTLQDGDFVNTKKFNKQGKLSTQSEGPYKFVEYSTPEKLCCVLEDGLGRQFTVNTEHVRKYLPRKTTEVVNPPGINPRLSGEPASRNGPSTSKQPVQEKEPREEVPNLLLRLLQGAKNKTTWHPKTTHKEQKGGSMHKKLKVTTKVTPTEPAPVVQKESGEGPSTKEVVKKSKTAPRPTLYKPLGIFKPITFKKSPRKQTEPKKTTSENEGSKKNEKKKKDSKKRQ